MSLELLFCAGGLPTGKLLSLVRPGLELIIYDPFAEMWMTEFDISRRRLGCGQ